MLLLCLLTQFAGITSHSADVVANFGESITFEAANEGGVTWNWQSSDGQTASGIRFVYSAKQSGRNTVTLTVSFEDGTREVFDRRVYVNPSRTRGIKPVIREVTLSQESVRPGASVQAQAHFYDPDLTPPFLLLWSVNQQGDLSRVLGRSINIPTGEEGDIDLGLVVRDGSGFFSQVSTRQIHVRSGNLPPETLSASDLSQSLVPVGQPLNLTARGLDPEGEDMTFEWTVMDGQETLTFNGSTINYAMTQPGLTSVYVTAKDKSGLVDPSPLNIPVHVYSSDNPPDLRAQILNPSQEWPIFEGDSVLLSGYISGTELKQEGVWEIRNVLDPDFLQVVEGNAPGRIRLEKEGLYQIYFHAQFRNLTSLEKGSRKVIPVQPRVDNRQPVIVFDDGLEAVPQGSTVTMTPDAADSDNDKMDLYWFLDGKYLGIADSLTTEVSLNDADQERGAGQVSYKVFPRDEKGGFPKFFANKSWLLYTDQQPITLGMKDIESGGTIYVPLGQNFSPIPTVNNPDHLPIIPQWTAQYAGEDVYFYSSDAGPGTILLPKPGLCTVRLDNLSDSPTFQNGLAHIIIYDPSQKPQASITRPSLKQLRVEQGDRFQFEGTVFEPNTFLPDEESDQVTQIVNTLKWSIERPDYTTYTSAGESLDVLFQEVGTYSISLSSVNSVGILSTTDQVKVVVAAPPEPDSLEPNDTRDTAARIETGRYGNLSVGPDDLIDWYRFDLTEQGSSIELEFDLTEAPSGVSAQVFFEEQLVSESALEGGKVIPFSYLGSKAGTYYIRLDGSNVSTKNGLSFGIGVTTLNPRLVFPYPKEDLTETTALTVVNPINETVTAVFEARDDKGTLLQEASFDLPPMGRCEKSVSSLFPGIASLSISWVRVRSSAAVVGLSFTTSRDLATSFAEPGFIGSMDELIVPHIAQATQQWFTHAAIVNNSPESGEAELKTLSGDYNVEEVEAAYSQSLIDFLTFFGGALPNGSEWARFEHQSGQQVLAGVEIFGKVDGNNQTAALNLSSLKVRNPNHFYVDRNIYFPHIAEDVQSFWTGIAFVNTGDTEAEIELKAFDQDGNVLGQMQEVMAPQSKSVDIAANYFPALPKNASISWLELRTTGAVQGYELFGSNDGTDRRLAGLQAVHGASTELVFAKLLNEDEGYFTGIAVLNLDSDQAAELTYTFYDDSGNVVGIADRVVEAGCKDVILASELLNSNQATWMRLESSVPVAGFALWGDQDGNFLSGATAQ